MTTTSPLPEVPEAPGAWTLAQIETALKRRLPEQMLKTRRTADGFELTFIEWHTAQRVLDKYAPGWEWKVTSISEVADRIIVCGELSIPTSDAGVVHRQATGTEFAGGSVDPVTLAEAQAFKRAAVRFGLGLYLYYDHG